MTLALNVPMLSTGRQFTNVHMGEELLYRHPGPEALR